jgi:hypothetical protein
MRSRSHCYVWSLRLFASRHNSASQILIVIWSFGCSETVLESRVYGRSYVVWRQVQMGWFCPSFLRVVDSYCTFKWRCTMISTTARWPAHDAYGYGERETVVKPSCSIVGSMGKMDIFEWLWVFGWCPLLPLMPQMNHLACRSHGCRSFLPRFTASSALILNLCLVTWLFTWVLAGTATGLVQSPKQFNHWFQPCYGWFVSTTV